MTHKIFQIKLNNNTLDEKQRLSRELVSELNGCNISWLSDGTAIISCDNTITEIQTKMNEKSLEVLETLDDRIKHEFEEQGIKQATEKLVQSKGKPKTTLEKKP